MSIYRIVIKRDGRLIGHFESASTAVLSDCKDVALRLSSTADYQLSFLVADGERRILESTPSGIRLLVAEQLFRPILDEAFDAAEREQRLGTEDVPE